MLNTPKNGIKTWSNADRPREKLMSKGPTSLTDTELLAILIQNGHGDRSAVDLARELLAACNHNLLELGRLSRHEMLKINGLGNAKACMISAALELGRRRHAAESLDRPMVRDSSGVAGYLRAHFQDLVHEVFAVVFLNRANRIINWEVVSSGGITGTVADPRIILKKALESGAVGLILCHNHPSGSLRPSTADQELTNKIREAARFLDIRLLDHVIVSQEGYFSFADEGLL
jgi:DNA repair protein RadC